MDETTYIRNSTSLKEKYEKVCQIIDALYDQQIAAVGNADVDSYTLNDGQTQISTRYRSPESIAKAIDHYERIKNRLAQRLSGTTIVRLADAKAIKSNGRRF